jgi:mannose-6-phosphate isomerase
MPISPQDDVCLRSSALVIAGVGDAAAGPIDALTRIQRPRELGFRHLAAMAAAGDLGFLLTARAYAELALALAEYAGADTECASFTHVNLPDHDDASASLLVQRLRAGIVVIGNAAGDPRLQSLLGDIPADRCISLASEGCGWSDFAAVCGRLHVAARRRRHDGGLAACGAIVSAGSLAEALLVEVTIPRPWGSFDVIANNALTSVRVLTIEAGRRLSLQRHHCRDELFIALDNHAAIDVCAHDPGAPAHADFRGTRTLDLNSGKSILIPRATWHRLSATGDTARVLEIAFGVYDQVEDIERLEDDYGRAFSDGSV